MFKHLFKAFAVILALLIFLLPLPAASTSPKATVVIPYPTTAHKKTSDLRIMSYNLLSDGIGFYGTPCHTRNTGVCNVINSYIPDIICLQECNRRWYSTLRQSSLTNFYSFITPIKTELSEYMTVMGYNAKVLTLIDSGNLPLPQSTDYRTRRAVYGVFRFKKGGNIFCVINTHLSQIEKEGNTPLIQADYITGIAADLRCKYNCPVLVAGDFNAKKRGRVQYPSSVVYDILTTFLEDARFSAQNRIQGSEKAVFSANNDHIFLSGQATVTAFGILSQKDMLKLSDHYPVYADFNFN